MMEAKIAGVAFLLSVIVPALCEFLSSFFRFSSFGPATNPVALANKRVAKKFFGESFFSRKPCNLGIYISVSLIFGANLAGFGAVAGFFDHGERLFDLRTLLAVFTVYALMLAFMKTWRVLITAEPINLPLVLNRFTRGLVSLILFFAGMSFEINSPNGGNWFLWVLFALLQPYLFMTYPALEESLKATFFERGIWTSSRVAHNLIFMSFAAAQFGWSLTNETLLYIGIFSIFMEVLMRALRYETARPDKTNERRMNKWLINALCAAAAIRMLG